MRDDVELLAGEVSERREQSLLVVLARRDRESERRGGPGCRGRSKATHRTPRLTGREPVEVPAVGLETRDIDVDGVRELRSRCRSPLPHDGAKALVRRDLPRDGDTRPLHSAIGLQRLWREPRPQHAAGRRRVARRDAELKRVVGETWAIRHAPHVGHGRRQRRRAAQIRQKVSSIHGAPGGVGREATPPTHSEEYRRRNSPRSPSTRTGQLIRWTRDLYNPGVRNDHFPG